MASPTPSPNSKMSYPGVKGLGILRLLENSESTTVTVGSQGAATTWHLPKVFLLRYSSFFAAALNGSFTEANLNSVTMPDDDPKVFRHWVQWMYVGRIIFKISRVEDINNVLVKAWILGDKLGCPNFQDIVMLELLTCHSSHAGNGLIGPSTLRTAYEGSAPGSMLRKWAIDFFLFETRNKACGKVSAEQRNKVWFSEAKDIDDFSQDYMEAGMKCSLEGEPANPHTRPSQYMVMP